MLARRHILLLLLAFSGCGIAYLISELIFSFVLLRSLGPSRQALLEPPFRIAAQTSKTTAWPQNYIGIFGDSYAQGAGDWFLDVQNNFFAAPFSSADIIFQRTGENIISFGAAGGGSMTTLVEQPYAYLEFVNSSYLFRLSPPKSALVYFYEGNDLSNNIDDFQLRFKSHVPKELSPDLENISPLVEEHVINSNRFVYLSRSFSPVALARKNLPLTGFLLRGLLKAPPEQLAKSVSKQQKPVVRALVGGLEVPLPSRLQGPPLELESTEMALGFEMFAGALEFSKKLFPATQFIVVYLPSPASVYELKSTEVGIGSYYGRNEIFPVNAVQERSDFMAKTVAEICRKKDVVFFDPRPGLKAAARDHLIHGPKDWKHFNRSGYTVLGNEVANLLSSKR